MFCIRGLKKYALYCNTFEAPHIPSPNILTNVILHIVIVASKIKLRLIKRPREALVVTRISAHICKQSQ